MSKVRLYDKFIEKLEQVNDESKTIDEHIKLLSDFNHWKQGVQDASGHTFNGDYYYIEMFDSGAMKERPMCCGVFLDWEHKDERN